MGQTGVAQSRRTKRNKLIADVREMDIVNDIYQSRTDGESLRSIAKKLNDTGVTGKQGGRFYASTVRNILKNCLYRDKTFA